MADSYAIQEAIAAVIEGAATLAKVKARNIYNALAEGQWGMLQSSADGNRARGWMVTQSADTFDEASYIPGLATYKPRYEVWQFYEYWVGDDDSNSEKTFAAERDAVKAAFVGIDSGILANCNPPSFPDIRITPEYLGNRLIHIARGFVTIAANETTAC